MTVASKDWLVLIRVKTNYIVIKVLLILFWVLFLFPSSTRGVLSLRFPLLLRFYTRSICTLFANAMATQSGCALDHCKLLISAPAW